MGQPPRQKIGTVPDAKIGTVPGHIIISAGEHQSVIEPAEHLLEQGWRLDTLGMTLDGVVCVEQLPPLLDAQDGLSNSRLVSVQLGNHETGVLQPVARAGGNLPLRPASLLHTDAVQVVGKLPVNFRQLGVAAMSVAAHKFQGPLGIGALLLRDGVPLAPLFFGGHQQSGLRPGTESAALAVGMATALELWQNEQEQQARRLQELRDRFENGLRKELGNVVVHGVQAAAASPNQQRGLSGARWAGAADGARSGRRGLFGRLGLFERLDASFRRRFGRWACPTDWWRRRCDSASAQQPPRRRSTRPSGASFLSVGSCGSDSVANGLCAVPCPPCSERPRCRSVPAL